MQKSTTQAAAALTALIALACLSGTAFAVSTSFWLTDSFQSLDAGRPYGTSVVDDGSVVLGPPMDEIGVPDAQYAWAAARGSDGHVYVATGTPGRLYRLGDREPELLLEDATADFPALAVSPDGDVYVASAPGGVVHRVGSGGDSDVFFDTGQGYVWSMAYSEEHGLIVGTGDSARVFAVNGDGEGRVIYESGDATVSAVAAAGDRVLAGTGSGGVALDVTPGRDVRVLFDSRYDEIAGMVLGPDGEIYIAATTVSLEQIFSEDDEFGAGFGDGSIYRTTAAGGVVELWYSEDAPVTALGLGADGRVWAGTGLLGRVYAIGPKGEVDVVVELADEQVLSIARQGEGVLVTTGLAAGVREIGAGLSESGTFESDVLDARAQADWGEVAWRAESPGGSSVRLLTRSGNATVPDGTWSDWEEVGGEGEGVVASPSARCLQWKAVLTGGRRAGPTLRAVEVAYVRANLPPRVIGVRVLPPGESSRNGDSEISESNRGHRQQGSGGRSNGSWGEPTAWNRGLRTGEWEPLDPDGDALEFDVWVKAEDESDWKLVESGIEDARFTWDSMSMPDGRYRLRVVASDEPSNRPDVAGAGEATSAPFVVDNSPPKLGGLEVSREGSTLRVSGQASDALSPISLIEVSVNYGEWEPVHPSDGSCDSVAEAFEGTLDVSEEGELSVAVRAMDRSGNVAVVRRVLR